MLEGRHGQQVRQLMLGCGACPFHQCYCTAMRCL
jgi:hypothetical protein